MDQGMELEKLGHGVPTELGKNQNLL